MSLSENDFNELFAAASKAVLASGKPVTIYNLMQRAIAIGTVTVNESAVISMIGKLRENARLARITELETELEILNQE